MAMITSQSESLTSDLTYTVHPDYLSIYHYYGPQAMDFDYVAKLCFTRSTLFLGRY
jgi:hypothetical protein